MTFYPLAFVEMSKLFPSIPLVAEEDSMFLRTNTLVDAVVDVLADIATSRDKLTQDDVLEAIDRGGKDAYAFGPKPATYWVSYFDFLNSYSMNPEQLC